jgi:hypothetical protein
MSLKLKLNGAKLEAERLVVVVVVDGMEVIVVVVDGSIKRVLESWWIMKTAQNCKVPTLECFSRS